MTAVYVDATTVIALGTIGELEQLSVVDSPLVIPPAVQAEVTTEPARTNLEGFLTHEDVLTDAPVTPAIDRATAVLGEQIHSGDVSILGAVLAHLGDEDAVGVISDDRRLRTVSRGLGAVVTGTIGIIIRSVEEGLPPEEAKRIVQQLDKHGLHMTAELRTHAFELIDAATTAERSDHPR